MALKHPRRPGLGSNLLLLLWLISVTTAYSAGQPGFHINGIRLHPTVTSMSELRWKNLVRQGWDLSCGAAALSTLLTYHHGRKFSEMAVTLTILKNSDPVLVRQRGGFSLYELKRFVRAVGLDGIGYGEMTLTDLELFAIPAILPIRINDIDHFVIFRKRVAGHVMLGDPAFGNLSLSVKQFEKLWRSQIAFYAVTTTEKERMAKLETARINSPLSPETMEMAIPNLGYGNRVISRVPIIPVTRRMTRVQN